jgi:predicted CXXCH cytochrome family protein
MKKLVCFLIALIAVAATGQTIVGSKHDLRLIGGGTPTGSGLDEVCVVCHTPHQALSANAQLPLWNRALSLQASYGVYDSRRLDSSPEEVGLATLGTASATSLCLSCHDGTVSVLNMLNPPAGGTTVVPLSGRIDAAGHIISRSNLGLSLADDHPVNFVYDTALAEADGHIKDPSADPAVAELLSDGRVQCSSCHDVHDPTNAPFLVMSNHASALCKTCHHK